MRRRVKFNGRYFKNVYFFTVEYGKTISKVYAIKKNNRIKIFGYPMTAGLVELDIPHRMPTIENIQEILEMEPIELMAKYRPNIHLLLPLPKLKNHKKLQTFGDILFAIYEYDDGYIIIHKNFYFIGAGPVPPINDNIFDMLITLLATKEAPNLDIIYAIDEVGEVLLFYDAL